MALHATTIFLPQSEADKETILQQLHRLLVHHTFRSSHRCPAFLRYIVERQLNGEKERLKERTIGIEVFGRRPDYDTAADPVVRTTASEVRKRIAQYYQEAGHERELRIEIPLRSYMAEFYLPENDEVISPAPAPKRHEREAFDPASAAASRRRKRLRVGIAALALISILAGVLIWSHQGPASAIRQFWSPVEGSKHPALVCLNTWNLSNLVQDPKSRFAQEIAGAGIDPSAFLPIDDVDSFSRLAGFLGAFPAGYHMQGAKSTTLSDLMQGPSVLIGFFGNPWTQDVLGPLRFHFVVPPNPGYGSAYIADRKNPSKRYALTAESGTTSAERDYAVIARVHDPATGQVSFVIAGLNAAGTTAASEFVTSPRYMDYLKTVLPEMSSSKSLEVVISVQVINGTPGAPHIEATEAW